jgi:hypothetical protein
VDLRATLSSVLDWARWCRRTLVAVGVLALVSGGVSLFGQPDREILYSADPPLAVCGAHGCTYVYRLEVGNSGAALQDEVIVRLRREAIETAILPVRVRDFGKVERRVRTWDEGDVRAYALGSLEPKVRVEIGFALAGPSADGATPWSRILAGVEAPGASVDRGSAAWTMLLRAWLAIFRVF